MDIWPKAKRSQVMSRIPSKDTKPELVLRSALHRLGYRYRIHSRDLPGKPDLVFRKYNTIIFVHGCFWHYHESCKEGRIPDQNSSYWRDKLHKNVQRDQKHKLECEELGWKVLVVWECEIEGHLDLAINKIQRVFRE